MRADRHTDRHANLNTSHTSLEWSKHHSDVCQRWHLYFYDFTSRVDKLVVALFSRDFSLCHVVFSSSLIWLFHLLDECLAPPLNSLTFRPVVGQLSEIVPFLLLEQRCGMACQAMLRRPRRCRCSRTGWKHTCSAAATKLFDSELHFFFLVIISRPKQWSLQ